MMTEKITHKMVVGYCRSAHAPNGETRETDEQREKLAQFAKERNLAIDHFYVDVGVSGATLKRTGFKQLLSDCKAGKVQTVLVADLERIARNNTLLMGALDEFEKLGIQLLCINKSGRGFFEILRGADGEFERQ